MRGASFAKSITSIDDNDNENGWFSCPYCGKVSKITEEFVSNPVLARWIRKNREARLRHKIAVLQELVTELEHDCKERYEAVEELLQRDKDNCHELAALKSANRELAIWLKQLCEQKAPEMLNKQPINRLVEKYAHERHRVSYSTYGQDVEGS